jgi:hypothetical protein
MKTKKRENKTPTVQLWLRAFGRTNRHSSINTINLAIILLVIVIDVYPILTMSLLLLCIIAWFWTFIPLFKHIHQEVWIQYMVDQAAKEHFKGRVVSKEYLADYKKISAQNLRKFLKLGQK